MRLKVIIPVLVIFVSGAANGLHETLHYHYASFQKRFKNADPTYWNPAESWGNKYEGGKQENGEKFLFSSTFLVFLTDAKHLLSEAHRDLLMIGCFMLGYFYREIKNRHHYLIVLLALALMYGIQAAGFTIVYDLIF